MTTHLPLFLIGLSGLSQAAELYTGPFGPGGSWNLYQRIDDSVTWNDAKRLAEELKAPAGNPELSGHLVTLATLAENNFMRLVSNRESTWCGLTDDERFGGREAGSHPRKGWKWITGESLSFSNWKPNEPDDWTGDGTGEDAVLVDRYGKWSDTGTGVAGQATTHLPYIVEWETHSTQPVAGAIPLGMTWSNEVVMPVLIPEKWSMRWVSGYTFAGKNTFRHPRTIPEATLLFFKDQESNGGPSASPFIDPFADPFAESFVDPFAEPPAEPFAEPVPTKGADATSTVGPVKARIQKQGIATGRMPWLWLSTPDVNRQGWLPSAGAEGNNFPTLPQGSNYIGAVVGKIHVEKAGSYTFAVSVEDAFALRIGGLKWKSASGDGFIDPLDPLTVTQPYGNFSAKALAVMELPAGDHLVEALWMVETSGSEFHVLAAPGVHMTEGSTSAWRPLGHEMIEEKIPSLGITAAGWTVECAPSSVLAKGESNLGLQAGLLKLELELDRISKTGLASVNFADAPETNPSHFPDASPFPNDRPDLKNDQWPLRARARLVVPLDGLYQIGLHAAGHAALHIKGGTINRISQTAQGTKGLNQRQDSFDFDGQADSNGEPKIVTEWTLPKGEYDIDVFYVKHTGPASLAIFSSPSGPYAPALLTTGGASLTADLPGLPHAKP